MRLIGVTYFLAAIFVSVESNDVPGEAKENGTLKKWNGDNKTAIFQVAVSRIVNGFCSKNPNACSLNFWNDTRKFFTRQVAIAQKFPRRQGNNLAVAFFVSLPDGNDIRKNGHTVIPELSLERVVQACSENISSVVGVAIQSVESYDAGTDSSSLTECLLTCKRRQNTIDIERNKQLKLREHSSTKRPVSKNINIRAPSNPTEDFTVERQPSKKTTSKKKHPDKIEESKLGNSGEGQVENGSNDRAVAEEKMKAGHKRNASRRWLEVEYSETEGVGESPIRERVNTSTNDARVLREGAEECKSKRNKTRGRRFPEGFAEGSLPHPYQLLPLQETAG